MQTCLYIHNLKEDKVRKLSIVVLLITVLAALAQAQNYGQVFGLTQTPTGYYNPIGSDATRNGHGDWLTRDSANGGGYFTPYYHLGQDFLVSTPTYTDGTPTGIGHPVYAIADGEIYYISKNFSWGQTSCQIITAVTGYRPAECTSDSQLVNNVAVFVKHQAQNGVYFLVMYAHMIDYNLVTNQPFENKDSKDYGAIHTTLTKGQAFAVLGAYPLSVPHLHFGVYPTFPPTYPPGKHGLANDTDAWQYTDSQGKPLVPDWGTPHYKFGLDDPINWLTTTTPNNYLTVGQAVINQTAMPSSITIPLGGVGTVPWQAGSLQGFVGTVQGNVVPRAGVSANHLKIKSVSPQSQVLGANQTVPLQSLVYLPSYLPMTAYTADIQTGDTNLLRYGQRQPKPDQHRWLPDNRELASRVHFREVLYLSFVG